MQSYYGKLYFSLEGFAFGDYEILRVLACAYAILRQLWHLSTQSDIS